MRRANVACQGCALETEAGAEALNATAHACPPKKLDVACQAAPSWKDPANAASSKQETSSPLPLVASDRRSKRGTNAPPFD